MLSKIISGEKSEELVLEKYVVPSPDQIDEIIAEKKRDAKRIKIIEENKDDPVQAAKKEANQILVEAQEKLKAAQLEANAIKSRQEKEIRTQLEKEFSVKLQAQVQSLAQQYSTSIETLLTLKDTVFKKSEEELMTLVFAITRKIIGDQVDSSSQVVLNMLKKGFEKIKEAKQYEIKIHPIDYDILLQEKDNLKEILKTSGNITFTKDESVERGGCQIVTESGEISAEPGKQLDIIMKELEDGT